MNSRTKTVLKGFMSLTSDEKNDLIEEMNRYIKSDEKRKDELRESIYQSLILGPLKDPCPCCGK